MRIVSVVGARPQFVKLAPIARTCEAADVDHLIVHTGQHYDPLLSDVFFDELHIPAPTIHLGVGSGSHGHQTGAIMGALDDVLPGLAPDWVLVYGDTNSTLAAAISAVKLHLPLAHLEAGLRSGDRRMPEEHNRVLTDHAADLLFAPTPGAAAQLAREGLAGRTEVVGDVMTDVLLSVAREVEAMPSPLGAELGLDDGGYSIATIHRAENTDDADRLHRIIASLRRVDHPVILLVHPRLRDRAAALGEPLEGGSLLAHDPLGYRELIASVRSARGVITDSGGLQKEAFLLRVPTTTVRPSTEWVETIQAGWNLLVEPGQALVESASRVRPSDTDVTPYGDGHAAERVVKILASRIPTG